MYAFVKKWESYTYKRKVIKALHNQNTPQKKTKRFHKDCVRTQQDVPEIEV